MWLNTVPVVVQTAFWVILASVAILTFLQARRTILQPLRTEVYKLQLQEISRLLDLFVAKDSLELTNYFGLSKMLYVNAAMLFDEYVERELGIPIAKDDRPYNATDCPAAQVTVDGLRLADDYLVPEDTQTSTQEHEPWSSYRHLSIAIPREMDDAEKNLRSFLHNPLLPSHAGELIGQVLDIIADNRRLVAVILTERAHELPEKYPTASVMEKASYDWLYQDWIHRSRRIEPVADQIVAFARDYFRADEFVSASRASTFRTKVSGAMRRR